MKLSLEEAIKKYFPINTRRKEIAKEEEELKKTIKSYMKVGEKFTAGDLSCEIQRQDKSYLDKEQVVEMLKSRGFTHAIKTVEVPDSDELERLIASGQIEPHQLQECMIEKIVGVLKVKQTGGKKNEKKAQKSDSKSKETF